jgi:hypothetical protein
MKKILSCAIILKSFSDRVDRGSYVEKLMANEEKTGDNNYQAKTLLKVEDRIVWLSDYGPEYGIVKWIGHLPEADTADLVAGIEFVSEKHNMSHCYFRKF